MLVAALIPVMAPGVLGDLREG
eukprot:COSAG01_NODE_81390_length_111_cov_781.750000_1_plen_21_part_10